MAAKLSGKRVLLVIAPEQFRDEELFQPQAIFKSEGAHTTIAACKLGEAKGMLGGTVQPDLLISDVKAENYDACVEVIGGMGSPRICGTTAICTIFCKVCKSKIR